MMSHGGILAQLGEHYIHIVGVTGSSPVSPTKQKPLERHRGLLTKPSEKPMVFVVVYCNNESYMWAFIHG